MKKIFSYMAGLAVLAAAGSCQEPIEQPVVEETPVVELEYQDVTFNVAAPSGPQTRTIYGETVTFPTELHVAVYVAEGNKNPDKVGTWLKDVESVIVPKAEGEGVINTKWEVTISLVKSYSYDIVFWTQKAGSTYYTIDWENATITADYTVAANDVTRDAFYHVAKGYNYLTANEKDARIQLTRPFAQINLGASDYAALIEHSGFVNGTDDPDLHTTITSASVTATIPNVLNVLTSKATGDEVVKFTVAPTTDLVNKVNDIEVTGTNAAGVQETMKYKLVGSNYIFANPYKENNPTVELDLTFAYNGKSFDINVPNVPYARNYQTNILGNFFTSNSKFNVVIVPGFNTEPGDEYVHVWDGYSVSEPAKTAEGYQITTGAELAWVAQQVNSGKMDFAGETLYIAEEIRLSDYPWTPIGTNANPFKGTIEGLEVPTKASDAEYFSISGLNVDYTAGPAGLVGVLEGGSVKNITLVDPVVNGAEHVGAAVGYIHPEGLVEGISVTGGEVKGNHYVGGIVGYAYGSVKNSVVDSLAVEGVYVDEDLDGAKIGGVIGFHPIDADDTEVSGNVVKSLGIAGKREVGAIAGAANAKNVKGNHVEEATIAADEYAGVIAGHVYNDEGDDVELSPKANTYAHEQIYVNGEQAKPVEYIFEVAYDAENTAIPVEGGEFTVTVTGNVAWTVTVPEGVTASLAEGEGAAEVTFTVGANDKTEEVSYTVGIATTEQACAVKSFEIVLNQEAAKPAGPIEATIAQFLAAEVDPEVWYILTGKITNIASTLYGNFNLTDETGTVYVYGLTETQVEKNDKSFANIGLREGDIVTLIGKRNDHDDKPEVGGPAYYVSHVPAPFLELAAASATIDAEATEYKIAVESNTAWTATASEGVTLDVNSAEGNAEVTMTFAANTTTAAVDHTVTFAYGEKTATFTLTQKGVPAPGEPEEKEEVTATLSFADKANRTEFDTKHQVWEQNGIKLINDKGKSTSNIADYAAPARFYKSSKITVECAGMTKIEFTCNTAAYATALKSSITNGSVTIQGSVVTVTLDSTADSYVIDSLTGGQTRIDSMTVTYLK